MLQQIDNSLSDSELVLLVKALNNKTIKQLAINQLKKMGL